MIGIEIEKLEFWLKTFKNVEPNILGVLPTDDVNKCISQIEECMVS